MLGYFIKNFKIKIRDQIKEINLNDQLVQNFISGKAYCRDLERKKIINHLKKSDVTISLNWWRFFIPKNNKVARQRVLDFFRNSETYSREANDLFISNEIEEYKDFFDSIEDNPLTGSQKLACVINEDHNLVLAGAGTGKTSTMMGRAGYFLKSEKYKASSLLMLAYNRKASQEMQDRQDLRFSQHLPVYESPKIKTFHALGLEILGVAEGVKPAVTVLAEDQIKLAIFVEKIINDLSTSNPPYANYIVDYFAGLQYQQRCFYDFESIAEYKEYVRCNELRTMHGELVKSYEELRIANYLYLNGIHYKYEEYYNPLVTSPDFKPYQPDFYLPDYDIYIEHFALDEYGKAPLFMKSKSYDYENGVIWKRNVHEENRTVLVETQSHQFKNFTVFELLQHNLTSLGVAFRKRSEREVLDRLKIIGEIRELSLFMCNLLDLYKQQELKLKDLRLIASNHEDREHLENGLNIFEPIYQKYEDTLRINGEIDFSDMIRRATEHVENGRYISNYSQIMVDEFQDISGLRSRFLKALLLQNIDNVLFCVGDDWQAIYRFAGSDISYIRDFKDKFGYTKTVPLDMTFRFNSNIGRNSSNFVLKNPDQVKKEIISLNPSTEPSLSMVRVVNDVRALILVVKKLHEKRKQELNNEPVSLLVLARYHFVLKDVKNDVEYIDVIKNIRGISIEFSTVHSAKGKEADYVLVLGLERGAHGFPSEKPNKLLFEILLPEQERYEFAEERRLFYVAITRAKKRVYLAYDPADASIFVTELLKDPDEYHIEKDEFFNEEVLLDHDVIKCPESECVHGLLKRRNSKNGMFAGCTNYPMCTYTENLCPSCRSLMFRVNGLRSCVNQKCNTQIPLCKKCGASMVERHGKYGAFWGCTNYSVKGLKICTHTLKIDKSN